MGYMRDHAIIVSGWDQGRVHTARAKAIALFGPLVSDVVPSATNGHAAFFVAPDGSKEGWDTSDEHDDKRAEFIGWLRDSDLNGYIAWVQVMFNDDEGMAEIVAHDADDAVLPCTSEPENSDG